MKLRSRTSARSSPACSAAPGAAAAAGDNAAVWAALLRGRRGSGPLLQEAKRRPHRRTGALCALGPCVGSFRFSWLLVGARPGAVTARLLLTAEHAAGR
jgi:hypothetical protein